MKVLWFKRSKELSLTQYVFYKIKRKNIIESSGRGVCTASAQPVWCGQRIEKKNDCKDHKSIQFIAIIMPFTVPHKIWEIVDINKT